MGCTQSVPGPPVTAEKTPVQAKNKPQVAAVQETTEKTVVVSMQNDKVQELDAYEVLTLDANGKSGTAPAPAKQKIEPAFSSKRAESVPIDPPGANGNAKPGPGPSPVKLASAAHEETQSLMFGDTEENSKVSSTPRQDGIPRILSKKASDPLPTPPASGPRAPNGNPKPVLEEDLDSDPLFAEAPGPAPTAVSAADDLEQGDGEEASTDPWNAFTTKFSIQSMHVRDSKGKKGAEVIILDEEGEQQQPQPRAGPRPGALADGEGSGVGGLWGSRGSGAPGANTMKNRGPEAPDLGLEELEQMMPLDVPDGPPGQLTQGKAETLDEKIKAFEEQLGVDDDDDVFAIGPAGK